MRLHLKFAIVFTSFNILIISCFNKCRLISILLSLTFKVARINYAQNATSKAYFWQKAPTNLTD